MEEMHDIELLPHGRILTVADGRVLMEALVESSIFLRADCGGRGRCGKCAVDIVSAGGEKRRIRSCNSRVRENMAIEIPESSLLSRHIIRKAPVRFPASFPLPAGAGEGEKGHGLAVDLGTTTIAVYLCRLETREIIASVAVKNPQALYGDDVMSRIGAVQDQPDNLEHLQKLARQAIQWGALGLLEAQGLEQNAISRMTVVGNPAMVHILLGIDPSPLGYSPYQPVFYEGRRTDSAALGFALGHIPLITLPQISGFIGGDILSAALAAELAEQPEGTMLIDLGTNGELLFKARDGIFATSCATGPAFEGASLSCGIQAVPGAINRVKIQDPCEFPFYSTILAGSDVGPVPLSPEQPAGLCGTGAISLVAELCRNMIVNPSGAFVSDAAIRPLQKDTEGRPCYALAEGDGAGAAPPLYLSQKDIRSVQLGKAALKTGIEFLLDAAGYCRLKKIVLAGAFGSFIDPLDMMDIGMIPKLPLEQVEIAGNSAGAGAVMVLCDERSRSKAAEMAARISVVELAGNLGFQEKFVENLNFPELQECLCKN